MLPIQDGLSSARRTHASTMGRRMQSIAKVFALRNT
nr:MAG TPA: hypothetical protein [Caudoviricetes sp.]